MPSTTPAARRRIHPGATLALLAFAQLIVSIDYNIVYVALPQIGSDLGFSAQHLQWVISGYAVAFGGFLLVGGRACDLLGPRRLFATGLVLYAVSSLFGGLAGSAGVLVAARVVQGIGGAFLFPATLTLVSTSFAAGRERNRAFAVWGTAGGSGMILGSLLGGVLTELLGWQSVFFVNVPLAGIAVLLAFLLIAPDTPHPGGRSLDVAGALTSTAGVTAVVFALVQGPESGWLAPVTLAAAGAGAVLLTVFVAVERRCADPLMPLRLFTNRDLSVGTVVTFLYMGTFGTLLYFLTVYFQGVHNYNALTTGLAFLIPMVAIAVGSQTAGRMATRYGTRTALTAALALGGVGAAVVGATMTEDASYTALIPGLIVLGIGQGAGFALMFGAATAATPKQDQGIASGIASTGQQVGGAVGLALLVAVANSGLDGAGGQALRIATNDGLRTAVFIAAAAIAITTLVALGLSKTPAQDTAASDDRTEDQEPTHVAGR